MSVITEVQAVQPEVKWKSTSKDIATAVGFWLATIVILPLLLAYNYGLAAITFHWVGQDFFWAWYGYLTGWPWLGAWLT
jgi:hypothetical protein